MAARPATLIQVWQSTSIAGDHAMINVIDRIFATFAARGSDKYADEDVTQQQHALQCGDLARNENANDRLVVAALLHDIGHIIGDNDLPADCTVNLDDHHENVGFEFLRRAFGEEVAVPVQLHVAAKRFLCTTDPKYQSRLSPSSLKSFLDQGGKMNQQELEQFRSHPYFESALRLRRWDDQAKDPNRNDIQIEEFRPYLEAVIK